MLYATKKVGCTIMSYKVTLLSSMPLTVGSGLRFWNFARILSQGNNEISIISPKSDLNLLPPFGKSLPRGIKVEFVKGGIPPNQFIPVSIHSFTASLASIRSESDFFHVSAVGRPPMALSAIVRKVSKGGRLIIDWDDMFGFSWKEGTPVLKVGNRLAFFSQNKVTKIADAVTVTSDSLAKAAISLGVREGRVFKLWNPCDTETFRLFDKTNCRAQFRIPDGFCIGVVGYPLPDGTNASAFINLLKAFADFLHIAPKSWLMMIGDRNIHPSYEPLLEKIRDRVLDIGRVPIRHIPKLLRAADILYLLMENNIMDAARWPMRFSDYLSSGRPIVCPAFGEVKFVLDKYSCGLKTYTSSEILNALELIYFNPDVGDKLGKLARSVAERDLSFAALRFQIKRLYTEVDY